MGHPATTIRYTQKPSRVATTDRTHPSSLGPDQASELRFVEVDENGYPCKQRLTVAEKAAAHARPLTTKGRGLYRLSQASGWVLEYGLQATELSTSKQCAGTNT
jgi:hypothetical protein